MELTRQIEFQTAFTVRIPESWSAEPDEEGGLDIASPEGPGLLHLLPFPQPGGEMPDPAEELYAFLADQEIELEDDEVEDVELAEGAELALCEYLTEAEEGGDGEGDEDEESATFWLVGVATAPGNLVFGSYSCPEGEEEAEREVVRAILASLRLRENP